MECEPVLSLRLGPHPCSVVSAVVCAFDLAPLSMPLPLTDQLATTICNLYQGAVPDTEHLGREGVLVQGRAGLVWNGCIVWAACPLLPQLA